MKFLIQSSLILVFLVFSISAQEEEEKLPRFENYEVPLYQGKIHLPKWIKFDKEYDFWRDDLEKAVDDPKINFAGKYFITAHSCGTQCAYYTITDLASGRDLRVLDVFSYAEPTPKTSDGYEYFTDLFYRPNSGMLIVQYQVDLGDRNFQCRERLFLFEAGKLKPITQTRRECGKFEEPDRL